MDARVNKGFYELAAEHMIEFSCQDKTNNTNQTAALPTGMHCHTEMGRGGPSNVASGRLQEIMF